MKMTRTVNQQRRLRPGTMSCFLAPGCLLRLGVWLLVFLGPGAGGRVTAAETAPVTRSGFFVELVEKEAQRLGLPPQPAAAPR